MISILAKGLVLAGALILLGSVFTTRRLIARLPQGQVRNHWYAMFALILVFIAGYVGYAWAFWSRDTRLLDLIVPVVFFFGGCFVWLTASLSLQTAVAVMRVSLLEQENIADPLTGVFNRRHLDRRLSEEVARARRHGLPLSILLIDLDDFKQVNDRHGHQAGDELLVSFAGLMKAQLREADLLARYGGEEVMVIAPQTAHQGAAILAERLRARLERNAFSFPSGQRGAREARVTCSIGVASLGGELDRTERLVHAADANLYRAKRDGRNRVNADVPTATGPAVPRG